MQNSEGATPSSRVPPAPELGERFRERLRSDLVAWLTTVPESGTPQPAPVWFLWVEETENVVIHSQATARRLRWIQHNHRASLHLNDDGEGHDYLVMTGTLHRAGPRYPRPDEDGAFLAKYRSSMDSVFGEPSRYATAFSVPLIFTPERTRGH